MNNYNFKGCLVDKKDIRDKFLARSLFANDTPLQKTDLSIFAPPIWDQGNLGSCTGQGVARAMMTLSKIQGKDVRELSRLFLYWLGRFDMGKEYLKLDSGAMVRGVIKMAQKFGACRESYFPENSWFASTPNNKAWNDAIKKQILSYYRCGNSLDVIKALSNSMPVVVGVSIYDSFLNPKNGYIVEHGKDEIVQGGHCMVVMGHDNITKHLLIHNSWGSAWGLGGKCWISYAEFDSILNDAWALKSIE